MPKGHPNPKSTEEARKRSREQGTLWRRNNPLRRGEINARHYSKMVAAGMAAYGSKCECCGESNPIFLTIDHVNGGGLKHKKQIKATIWNWLRRNSWPREGFKLLCFNCNCGRQRNGGVCPHEEVKCQKETQTNSENRLLCLSVSKNLHLIQ